MTQASLPIVKAKLSAKILQREIKQSAIKDIKLSECRDIVARVFYQKRNWFDLHQSTADRKVAAVSERSIFVDWTNGTSEEIVENLFAGIEETEPAQIARVFLKEIMPTIVAARDQGALLLSPKLLAEYLEFKNIGLIVSAGYAGSLYLALNKTAYDKHVLWIVTNLLQRAAPCTAVYSEKALSEMAGEVEHANAYFIQSNLHDLWFDNFSTHVSDQNLKFEIKNHKFCNNEQIMAQTRIQKKTPLIDGLSLLRVFTKKYLQSYTEKCKAQFTNERAGGEDYIRYTLYTRYTLEHPLDVPAWEINSRFEGTLIWCPEIDQETLEWIALWTRFGPYTSPSYASHMATPLYELGRFFYARSDIVRSLFGTTHLDLIKKGNPDGLDKLSGGLRLLPASIDIAGIHYFVNDTEKAEAYFNEHTRHLDLSLDKIKALCDS